MYRSTVHRPTFLVPAVALIAALLLATGIAGATSFAGKTVVKAAGNVAADAGYLTNVRGRTLYTLSNERKRFACKGACLKSWPPLLIPADVKPVGPVKLGVGKRPDGRVQVTYRGLPLYTFSGDTKKGDKNGEGLKTGGGTWHVSFIGNQTCHAQSSDAIVCEI
jgi:predicted lipoprotein with Yx(FWY)xxD motif